MLELLKVLFMRVLGADLDSYAFIIILFSTLSSGSTFMHIKFNSILCNFDEECKNSYIIIRFSSLMVYSRLKYRIN